MRFIDSNVFLYAIVKPKKALNEKVVERKKIAKEILLRIEKGSNYCGAFE